MRVAMILGVLRRETSHDPPKSSSASTTHSSHRATRIRHRLLHPHGSHGRVCICQCRSHCALHFEPRAPDNSSAAFGLVAGQNFELVHGTLNHGERLVLLSDGVPEARSQSGELFGFERTAALCSHDADHIARTAQQFGQEDDITVVSLSVSK